MINDENSSVVNWAILTKWRGGVLAACDCDFKVVVPVDKILLVVTVLTDIFLQKRLICWIGSRFKEMGIKDLILVQKSKIL